MDLPLCREIPGTGLTGRYALPAVSAGDLACTGSYLGHDLEKIDYWPMTASQNGVAARHRQLRGIANSHVADSAGVIAVIGAAEPLRHGDSTAGEGDLAAVRLGSGQFSRPWNPDRDLVERTTWANHSRLSRSTVWNGGAQSRISLSPGMIASTRLPATAGRPA